MRNFMGVMLFCAFLFSCSDEQVPSPPKAIRGTKVVAGATSDSKVDGRKNDESSSKTEGKDEQKADDSKDDDKKNDDKENDDKKNDDKKNDDEKSDKKDDEVKEKPEVNKGGDEVDEAAAKPISVTGLKYDNGATLTLRNAATGKSQTIAWPTKGQTTVVDGLCSKRGCKIEVSAVSSKDGGLDQRCLAMVKRGAETLLGHENGDECEATDWRNSDDRVLSIAADGLEIAGVRAMTVEADDFADWLD